MIEARGLTRRYGDIKAVDGLDLDVAEGRVVGLLGPNGAGKTTTLNLLLGLTRPTAGQVRVLGSDPRRAGAELRREVAFVPEGKSLYPAMRVGEFLRFYGRYFPDLDKKSAARRLERWGIAGDGSIKDLSPGERLRTLLAAVLARHPRLYLLDEPTAGLDVGGVEDLLEALVEMHGEAAATVLATNRIEQVERVCDRVVVLDRGRLVLEGDLDDLKASWKRIVVRGKTPADAERWTGVVEVRRLDSATVVTVSGEVESLAQRLAAADDPPEIHPMSLREIYLAVVQR